MDKRSISQLLEELKNPDENIRDRATAELWHIWFHQKGVIGFEQLRQAEFLIQNGDINQAEIFLTEIITKMPDFAEAWNRRAVLYYSIGEYRKALSDCQKVLWINPIHFGALHGLGLCHAALAEYREAIQAFRQALEIQPYTIDNQRLLLECTARLS